MPYDMEKLQQMFAGVNQPKKPEPPKAPVAQIIQVPIGELVDFPPEKHRFRPATGERMKQLEESIRFTGILNALLVRVLPNGQKQILAGHNRRTAARNIGYTTVPCVIKNAPTDDEAQLIMIHDNLNNRETLLPSELGWAYRDYMEINRRQGRRTDLAAGSTSSQYWDEVKRQQIDSTSGRNGRKLESADKLGDESGKNGRDVRRYIRLTYLILPLLNLVDEGKIGLRTGEQLSYLSQRSQEIVYNYCYAGEDSHPLKEKQARVLREAEEDPDQVVDSDLLDELFAPKPKARFRTLRLEMTELRNYFPVGTPEEVVRQTIQTALANYFEENKNNGSEGR